MESLQLTLTERNSNTKFTIITNLTVLQKQEFYKLQYSGKLNVANTQDIGVDGTIVGCQLFLYLGLLSSEDEKDEKEDTQLLTTRIDDKDFETLISLTEPYGFTTTNDNQVTKLTNILKSYGLLSAKRISIDYFHELQTLALLSPNVNLLNKIKVTNKFINIEKFYFSMRELETLDTDQYTRLFEYNFVNNKIIEIFDKYLFGDEYSLHSNIFVCEDSNYDSNEAYYFDRTNNSFVKFNIQVDSSYGNYKGIKYIFQNNNIILQKIDKALKCLLFCEKNDESYLVIKKSTEFLDIFNNHNKNDTELKRFFYCSNLQGDLCVIDLCDPNLMLHIIGDTGNYYGIFTYQHLKVSECGYLILYEGIRFGKYKPYLYDYRTDSSRRIKLNFYFDFYLCAFSNDSTELIIIDKKNQNMFIYDVTNIHKRGILLLGKKQLKLHNRNFTKIFC